MPKVSAGAFGLALSELGRDRGLGPGRRAVLVLDRAGWHRATELAVSDGLELAFLPAPSPISLKWRPA